MSNPSPKRTNPKKQAQKATRTPQEEPLSHRSVRWLVAALSILASLVALLSLMPRVSASLPSSPVDPNDILSGSFEVSNTGYIPLKDVSIELASAYIGNPAPDGSLRGPFKDDGSPTFGLRFQLAGMNHHYLGIDDRLTVNPGTQFQGEIGVADIAIVVKYQPWFIPIQREKLFRFILMPDRQGRIYWRSWPVDERAP